MAMLGDFFGGKSANDIEETSFDPLPMGDYTLVVVDSQVKPTKDGSGEYLNCEMEVVDGQYKGRKLFIKFNWKNANPKAVSIARAELAALCRAVRVPAAKETSELHDKPFDARIGIQPGNGNYGPQNNIKKYAVRGGLGATPVGTTTGGGQATNDKKPWER
jgi:hypothetical protein